MFIRSSWTAGLAPAALLFVVAGCATTPEPTSTAEIADVHTAMPMLDGFSGQPMSWDVLMDRIAAADVVILGERHDDAAGHAFQQAVVEAVATRWPGTVLTLEMLERDEQDLVDDYADGIIDAEKLAVLSHSQNWGGKGRWDEFYQPSLDAAMTNGGRVVAANAPRRYVRLARTDGYERLDALPSPRQEWFDRPDTLPDNDYRDRFWEVMGAAHADETDDDMIESSFRSQLVWDATMAASIANARNAGAPKVVHLVGQFHCEFDGGLVQQVRRFAPSARILVVTGKAQMRTTLADEDVGRADVVVYTRLDE